MPTVTNYTTLTQAILDFTHRPALSTYTDYFIQAAQEEITNDIFAANFGNGIRLMEAIFPPTAIGSNGTIAAPSDWLTPKYFTVTDADGNQYELIFKDPGWIYDRYPERSAEGIPAYIARDISPGYPELASYATFTATALQTSFDISSLAGDTVLFVTLDGSMLVQGTDYSIAGNTLTLTTGASAGQILYVQTNASQAVQSPTNLTATATAAQTAFDLTALDGATILFVTLDGAMLTPTLDYTVSGNTLTLTTGASVGQNLYVQAIGATSGTSVFIFGPYPDSSYSVQGTYYQSAPLLSATQATNWMVTSAPSMLLANCMRQAGKFLKDVPMVEGWTQLYQDALTKLIERDTAARFGEGTLVVSTGAAFP